ncbi:MAG: sensor histidine kinase, partial [uncultured Friedmanniella sp.]
EHPRRAADAGPVREGQRGRAGRPRRAGLRDRVHPRPRAVDPERGRRVVVGAARGPDRPRPHRRARGDAAGGDGRAGPLGRWLPGLGRAGGLPGHRARGHAGPGPQRPGRRPQALDQRLEPVRGAPHRGSVPHGPHDRVGGPAAGGPRGPRHPGRRAGPRAQQPGRGGDTGGGRARRGVRPAPVDPRRPRGHGLGGAAARRGRVAPRADVPPGRGRRERRGARRPGGRPRRLAPRPRRAGRVGGRPGPRRCRRRRRLVRPGLGGARAGSRPGHGLGGGSRQRRGPAVGGEGVGRAHLRPRRGGQVLLPDGPGLPAGDRRGRRARQHPRGAAPPDPGRGRGGPRLRAGHSPDRSPSRRAQPGVDEPHQQRRRRHGGHRDVAAVHVPGARRRQRRGGRHGPLGGPGHQGAGLRALLHHEGGRRGDRSRPGHRTPDRRRPARRRH